MNLESFPSGKVTIQCSEYAGIRLANKMRKSNRSGEGKNDTHQENKKRIVPQHGVRKDEKGMERG
jgi:hypothetical protein